MGFTSPQVEWQRGALQPWLREGLERVDVSFADRERLLAAHADANGRDPFFWFRAACLGWWQELSCS
jgi:hypothetical protein